MTVDLVVDPLAQVRVRTVLVVRQLGQDELQFVQTGLAFLTGQASADDLRERLMGHGHVKRSSLDGGNDTRRVRKAASLVSLFPPLPRTLGEEAADQPQSGPVRTRHARSRSSKSAHVTAKTLTGVLRSARPCERRSRQAEERPHAACVAGNAVDGWRRPQLSRKSMMSGSARRSCAKNVWPPS